MDTAASVGASTPKTVWVGQVISVLVCGLFAFSAYMKLAGPVDPRLATVGIPEEMLKPLAVVELLCVVTYMIPVTSVLGAVLFTGYIGGAILTHWRVDQNVILQIVLGILIWLALCLRETRLWKLLPIRTRS